MNDTRGPMATGLGGPHPATAIAVTFSGGATAGTAFTITCQSNDALGNKATLYGGTCHFTSTDGSATLPSDGGFSSGGPTTFNVTFATAGSQTVTATDNSNHGIKGTSASITVSGGGPTVYVYDQFSGSGNMSGRTPDTTYDSGGYNAGQWGTSGYFDTAWSVAVYDANTAINTAGDRTQIVVDAGHADGTLTAGMQGLGGGSLSHYQQWGVSFRFQDGQNFWSFVADTYHNQSLLVEQTSGSGQNTIASTDCDYNAYSFVNFKVVMSGSTVHCYNDIGGSYVEQFPSNTSLGDFDTATICGLVSYNCDTNGNEFTYFKVTS